MQVILLENIINLGKIGDIVKVKRGYARNYLIKFEKALNASKENIEIVSNKKKQLNKKDLELKKEATTVQIKNNMCTKIVDGRELAKSKIKDNSKPSEHKKQELGEFVGLMRLSKHGSMIFIKRYEELINSHTGSFHEAHSISQAYFTDMLQELIDNDTEILPIPVQGKWCEIDTIEDLKRAEDMF